MESRTRNALFFVCKMAVFSMVVQAIFLVVTFDYEDTPRRIKQALALRGYNINVFAFSEPVYILYRDSAIKTGYPPSTAIPTPQQEARQLAFFFPEQWKRNDEFTILWGSTSTKSKLVEVKGGIVAYDGLKDLISSPILPFWELHSIQTFHAAYLLNSWGIHITFLPALIGMYLFVHDVYRLGRRVHKRHTSAVQTSIALASVTPQPQIIPLPIEIEEERALRAQEQEERRMQKRQSNITQYEQEIRTLLQALAVRTSTDGWQKEFEDILKENRSPKRKLRRLQHLHDKLSAAHPSPVP